MAISKTVQTMLALAALGAASSRVAHRHFTEGPGF
jgi:hypothetical protein